MKKAIKSELEHFIKEYKKIKKNTALELIDKIEQIDNVKSVIPDEFNEIYTINVANLFTIHLKIYKELRKVKLGSFIYLTDKDNKIVKYKELLNT